MWLQKNDAICYTFRENINLLGEKFNDIPKECLRELSTEITRYNVIEIMFEHWFDPTNHELSVTLFIKNY